MVSFTDFFESWLIYAKETPNYSYKFLSCLFVIALVIFYAVVRFFYHILKNIKSQIIYLIYDYTNLNLSSYSSFFRKPNLRTEIRKKITLDDDDDPQDHSFWFTSRYLLYHINLMMKRYHFVIVNIVMLLYTTTEPFNFYVSIDVLLGINVNRELLTFLQIVVAVIIGYFNVVRSDKIRKDLTSFIRSITKRHEKIIDSNSTMLKTIDEVIIDLRRYGFVHLRTDDEYDIILSTTEYKKFNVAELRELIVDGVIVLNGIKFRYLSVNEHNLEGQEDIFLHIYFYNHYSLAWTRIYNITINDLRIHDTLSVFLLFLYYFTSLDLQGYFNVLYGAILFFFVFLLFLRRQEERAYSFAWFDRNQLKWVRNKGNAKLETDSSRSQNRYLLQMSDQNYFQILCEQLAEYRHRYKHDISKSGTVSEALHKAFQEDLMNITCSDCLLFFAMKTGCHLSYRFEKVGFLLSDFILFLDDVAFHYRFSYTIRIVEGNISVEAKTVPTTSDLEENRDKDESAITTRAYKTIYSLQNPSHVHECLVVCLREDGYLLSATFEQSKTTTGSFSQNLTISQKEKAVWFSLWGDVYVR